MTRRRPFRELFATAITIVAVWFVVALLQSSARYRVAIDMGRMPGVGFSFDEEEAPYQLWQLLTYFELTSGLLWATLTPVILYVAERLPLRRPFRWRNVVGVLAVTPLLASCRAVSAGAVQRLAAGGRHPGELLDFLLRSIHVRFHDSVLVTLVVFGVYNLLLAYRAAAASDRQLLEAKKQLANDELQRLRAGVQPRFFFGALREVKAQMRQSPVVADQMIVQLAAVLRRMLELEQHADVSLAEEFDLVDRCLRLEETRTGGRFEWNIAADESLLGARVPPLVLHTIVVPAVMVDGAGRGKLEIDTCRKGDELSVSITVGDPARLAGDEALEVTRARLTRRFGEHASSVARTPSGIPTVVVTMPFVGLEPPPS
ncbi:MAG TPA: histidine kinase [Thermoanaerobaculia bacterium]|jgi:hypothetical protein